MHLPECDDSGLARLTPRLFCRPGHIHSAALHSLQDNQSERGGHQSAADPGEPLPQQTGERRSRPGQKNRYATGRQRRSTVETKELRLISHS